LLKNDKENIGEVYDAFSYSSSFLRFISKREVENSIRQLLCFDTTATLYGWTNRVRIDPPRDNRRTYGWHQETFYTHPEFHYLQTWAPIIRNTTKDNGTIRIKPKSHKEGIPPQTWNEISGRATQILIDAEVLSKYPSEDIEMSVGDLLFFDGRLAHSSGSNTSSEVRYSLVGMWNDTTDIKFKSPKPYFESRSRPAKEYFIELMGRDRLHSQA